MMIVGLTDRKASTMFKPSSKTAALEIRAAAAYTEYLDAKTPAERATAWTESKQYAEAYKRAYIAERNAAVCQPFNWDAP